MLKKAEATKVPAVQWSQNPRTAKSRLICDPASSRSCRAFNERAVRNQVIDGGLRAAPCHWPCLFDMHPSKSRFEFNAKPSGSVAPRSLQAGDGRPPAQINGRPARQDQRCRPPRPPAIRTDGPSAPGSCRAIKPMVNSRIIDDRWPTHATHGSIGRIRVPAGSHQRNSCAAQPAGSWAAPFLQL